MGEIRMKRSNLLIFTVCLWVLSANGLFSLGFCEVLRQPLLVTKSMTIDRDLEFAQTAFVIKGSNIILDLGGRTIIFNAADSSRTINKDFEDWEGDKPVGWEIIAGKAHREPAIYFGKFDLFLSPGGAIESAPIRLKGGKTYLAFAFVKGSESDKAVLKILRAEDRTVLAQRTWGNSVLRRGYASKGSVDADLIYKPKTDRDIILSFQLIGTSPCRVGMVDIKPAFDYGVVTNNYHEPAFLPDLPPSWFRGTSKNITIRNGRIVQGNGQGVRSAGVRINEGEDWKLENLEIHLNGLNTDGVSGEYLKNTQIDSITIESSSSGVFNRMHGTAGVKLNKTTGATVIKNTNITNVPQMGISVYGCYQEGVPSSTHISGNTIKQKETVTEGYGIAVSGLMNWEISGNTIEPFKGRGVLVDAASGCSSGKAGTLRGTIRDNRIIGLYETGNFEYAKNELESAGIRLRNWGEENQSHRDLQILNNTISGWTDGEGVQKVYGINVTANAPHDSIRIMKNDVTVKSLAPGSKATCLIFQNTKVDGRNYVYVAENVLKSNSEILRFGGNDGAETQGIILEGNSLIRLNDPPAIGKPFHYGYWEGRGINNILAKNTFHPVEADPSVIKNFSFEGTGIKHLMLGRHRIEVSVRFPQGPVLGANITLKNKEAKVLFERITDLSGKALLFSPAVYYSVAPPAPPQKRTYLAGDSLTITASFLGKSKSAKIIADKDLSLEIVLDK